MAWANLQKPAAAAGAVLGGTTLAKAFAGGCSYGSRIIVFVSAWKATAVTCTGVTDSAGNPYSKDLDLVDATSTVHASIWSAPNFSTSTVTVTATISASGATVGMAINEFSGLSMAVGSAAVDGTGSASANGATSITTSAFTTTGLNEMVFGTCNGNGDNKTFTKGATYTAAQNNSPEGNADIATQYKDTGASGTSTTSNYTMSAGTGHNNALMVIYKLAITAIGTLVSAVASPAQATLSVTPAAKGNLLALAIETKFTSGQNYFVTGVSGGGVLEWTRWVQLLPDNQAIHEITIWTGIVTSTGAQTITATYSNAGTASTELSCQEFRPWNGTDAMWAFDVGGVQSNAASTAPPYPSLTPTFSGGELYFGFIQWPGSGSAGATAGCVYATDANGNQCVYCTNVTATLAPVASSASQVSSTGAVLMRLLTVKPPAPPSRQAAMRAAIW